MNSLRDKLLNAGLVTEDEARASEEAEARERARKKERRRKRTGPKGPDGTELTPEELAAAEKKREEREREAIREKERRENRKRAAKERQIAEDIRRVAEALGVETGGEETFYFQSRKGRIQRLSVSAEERARLERGELAVIERPLPGGIEFAVVPREGAEAVLGLEPRSVRFYVRSETESYGAS